MKIAQSGSNKTPITWDSIFQFLRDNFDFTKKEKTPTKRTIDKAKRRYNRKNVEEPVSLSEYIQMFFEKLTLFVQQPEKGGIGKEHVLTDKCLPGNDIFSLTSRD